MPSYRFGKHPPKADYRTLRLADYLTPSLPPAPPAYDALARVATALPGYDTGALYPLDANDTLGCCTIAALAHASTVWHGLLGKHKVMTRAAVVKLYFHLTGGIDSGLNELDVLNYWRKHSESGDKILAFASINPSRHDHIMQAVSLFGGVYIGFQCQRNCVEQFDAKKPWTPGKLTNDGHAVFVTGYDPSGVTCLTWGAAQAGTWAWWDECVQEAYAIISPECKDPAFCPGVDFAALTADLAAVAE
jgi:hypothetical protein